MFEISYKKFPFLCFLVLSQFIELSSVHDKKIIPQNASLRLHGAERKI
jgi:hypothetical protein